MSMRRILCPVLLVFAMTALRLGVATAQGPAALPLSDEAALAELLKPVPAKEPHEVLATFEVHPSFRLELVAYEPLVCSPVAAAFDAQGRMFVAEMRDYPFRPAAGEAPLGRVRLLEDTDGDGRFDRSHVFADELLWPTGVMPWRDGVFVAAAPSIYYFRDTDGDGRADEREIVFTGFGTQNEQGSVNNLVWGLDNRIYGSSSKNGGAVRLQGDAGDAKTSVLGRDFRFHPVTRQLEAISGNSQFGLAFDDWGRRFLCDQANTDEVVILPLEYLTRNPYLKAPRVTDDPAQGVTPIFRSSPHEGWRIIRSTRRLALGERGAESSGLSHDVIDGAAGLGIYRGQAFAAEFRGQLFVGDAQNNVVHRRQLLPRGVSFTSQRVDEKTEFIRSSDNWFRPVNALNAPDGALYLCDMSREQIESVHVPLDVWKRVDLTRGRGRGRIYRVVPTDFKQPARSSLHVATIEQLVSRLEHPGAWWRETAQRLIFERQDQAAAAPLRQLVHEAALPQARMHALYALDGLGCLEYEDARCGLADKTPAVREHALKLAERWLDDNQRILQQTLELAADDQVRVRMQAAFSLGQAHSDAARQAVAPALAQILIRDGADEWVRIAALSSTVHCSALVASRLWGQADYLARGDAAGTLEQLAYQVGRAGADAAAGFLEMLHADDDLSQRPATLQTLLIGLAEGCRDDGRRLLDVAGEQQPQTAAWLGELLQQAPAQATDVQLGAGGQIAAVRLLKHLDFAVSRPALVACVEPQQPQWLALPAIDSLRHFDETEVAPLLLANFRQYLPAVRGAVLDALLTRQPWCDALLAAIERGDVVPQLVPATQQQALVRHRDDAIRARAEKLFNGPSGPRQKVIDRYRPALSEAADKSRGQTVFLRECQACHKLGDRGHAVGPNLALVRNRTPEQLLTHILDPNLEVQPAYLQYVVATTDGATYTGMVAADAGGSLTLRRDNAAEATILKDQIEEFSSTDKSLMPEGFERTISVTEMADLLAYLGEMQYDIGTNPGHDEPGAAAPASSNPRDPAP